MKFSGKIGYADSVEIRPGVWEDIVDERSYFGDVIKDARKFQDAEQINDNLAVTNVISIVADAYANEHIHALRYVEWMGARWTVSAVEVASPRLRLRLGGIYNGPEPA